MTTEKRRPPQTRWGHPAITLSLGVIIGGAAWVGGEPVAGLAAFGLCAVAIVAWHVATARSERFRETFEADERWGVADMRAGRLAALSMLTALMARLVYELARGRSLDPFEALVLAIGALTYVGAQVVFSRRL